MSALFLSALLLGFVFNAASGAPVGRAASAADMGADDRALGHVR